MSLPSRIETVIVGAGQAGLTMSWFLRQAGREHLLVDRRATLGGGWQDRWDAFRLVSPNWTASFPGAPYDGADPHGFMPRREIADRVAAYAARIDAPVHLETAVERLAARPSGGFRLDTTGGSIEADQVVVAAGSFHRPRLPVIAADLPARLTQLHSHDYRSEGELPPGGVLVVGTGQSGVQIAEELMDAGRDVHLSVGTAGRVPRRYRGSDIFRWLHGLGTHGDAVGVSLPTVDQLPDPRARLMGNPHLSGHGGGHDTNLRQFAAAGMTLIGRIEGVRGERLSLADDLRTNLGRADAFFDERFRESCDRFIERSGIDTPPDERVPFAFEPPALRELDLAAAGISTVIWTTGYRLDYGWLDLPILDDLGFPRQHRGVSEVPGLHFLGLLWQRNQLSATLMGSAIDAGHLAAAMGLPAIEWERLGMPGAPRDQPRSAPSISSSSGSSSTSSA
jgi:putative flavoprotein involved in K+ transport